MNFGVYANGHLVESCNINYLEQYSGMDLTSPNLGSSVEGRREMRSRDEISSPRILPRLVASSPDCGGKTRVNSLAWHDFIFSL